MSWPSWLYVKPPLALSVGGWFGISQKISQKFALSGLFWSRVFALDLSFNCSLPPSLEWYVHVAGQLLIEPLFNDAYRLKHLSIELVSSLFGHNCHLMDLFQDYQKKIITSQIELIFLQAWFINQTHLMKPSCHQLVFKVCLPKTLLPKIIFDRETF